MYCHLHLTLESFLDTNLFFLHFHLLLICDLHYFPLLKTWQLSTSLYSISALVNTWYQCVTFLLFMLSILSYLTWYFSLLTRLGNYSLKASNLISQPTCLKEFSSHISKANQEDQTVSSFCFYHVFYYNLLLSNFNNNELANVFLRALIEINSFLLILLVLSYTLILASALASAPSTSISRYFDKNL